MNNGLEKEHIYLHWFTSSAMQVATMIRGENGTPKMSEGWIFLPRFYWPLLLFSGRFPFCTCSAHNSAPALLPKLPPGERGRNISSSLFFESLSLGELVNEPERREESPRTWSEQKMERDPKIRPNSSFLIRMCAREKKTFPLPSFPPFLRSRQSRTLRRGGGL